MRCNPNEHWAMNVSYGYTNAKFLRFVDGENDYRNHYVPYAPSNTLFASATYSHSVESRWALEYNLNTRGVGRIYWNEENDASQPFYAQLGASVTAKCDWLSIEGWMENVTGTKFDTFYFESMSNRFLQRGKTRRFGVTVRLEFGASRK